MVKTKNKYDVVIVTDGNPQIGLGYIMRCVAIADALTEMKISVLFIASDTMSVSEIKILGYDVLCLNTDYKALRDQSDKIAEIVIEYHIRFVFLIVILPVMSFLEMYQNTVLLDVLDMERITIVE